MTTEMHRRRRALFLLYSLPGLVLASWVTRTPAIRDSLDASTGEMGLVLFGLSTGSLVGIYCSGVLVRRVGTRRVAMYATGGLIFGVCVVAAGAAAGAFAMVFAGLFLFGAGMGANEIALNIDGADVERRIGRPVLPALHGFFSLGTVVGAVVGIALAFLNFSVAAHLLIVAVACLPVGVVFRDIPGGYGRVPTTAVTRHGPSSKRVRNPLRDRRIVMICAAVLALTIAEGAAMDWLPLLMVDGHGFDPVAGSVVFAGFAASMTIARFCGSALLSRFGRVTIVQVSALLAASGLAIIIFSSHAVFAGVSVILWGFGAALGFPAAISAAGDGPGDRSRAVSAVATAGSCALLVGPPFLGFLGEHTSLRAAMVVILALMAVAVVCAPAMRPLETSGGERQPEPARL